MPPLRQSPAKTECNNMSGKRRKAAYGGAAVLSLLVSCAYAADANMLGTWLITQPQSNFVPTDGPIPFTTDGIKEYEHNKADLAKGDYADFDITQARCTSPGVPRLALVPEPFRIWLGARVITFQYAWNRLNRTVSLGEGPEKLPPMFPIDGQKIGWSRSHWEGNTLVIKVDNLSGRTLIDDLVPHSDGMTVEERWRLLSPNVLQDQITITDPDTFTRPWHTQVTFKRVPTKAFPEDICLDRRQRGELPLSATKPPAVSP